MSGLVSSATILSPQTASRISSGPGAINVSGSNGGLSSASVSKVNSARDVDEYYGYNNKRYDYDDYVNKYIRYNEGLLNSARAWEEKMSNTAIQRQMEDLKKAGINPILAGRIGGASYNAVNPSYVSLNPTSMVGQLAQAEASRYSADVSRENVKITAENSYRVAQLYCDTNIEAAEVSSNAAIRSAGISASAIRYSADTNASAKKYGDELTSNTQKWIAGMNINNTKELQEQKLNWQEKVLLPWYYKNNHDLNWNSILGGAASAGIGSLPYLIGA